MSIVDNEELKTAVIAHIKSISAITDELASAEEVRESYYQGTTFGYPNVRIRIIRNERISNCFHEIQVGVMVFSEQQSSKEAEHISGIIASNLNDSYFSENNVAVTLRITNMVPAVRTEKQTWRSETLYRGVAS